MLGNSVKSRGDLKMERTDSTKAYGQADGKGVGMAAKRAKSGVPQSTQRGELKVYRAGSSDGRLPVPSNLRKQRSMTNLAILTDAEKKLHLYEPKWCDDMTKPGAGQTKMGKPKTAGGGNSAGGGAPLSRNLSKSEHSLFQGKPKPFSPLAAPSALSKQSRIPRGPYAEVKPLSKAPEDGKSDDEILSTKAKGNAKKQGAGAGGESGSKGQGEEGGDKPFLKVDPELVVTVLGDLEQLLFSQMLGEYSRAVSIPLLPQGPYSVWSPCATNQTPRLYNFSVLLKDGSTPLLIQPPHGTCLLLQTHIPPEWILCSSATEGGKNEGILLVLAKHAPPLISMSAASVWYSALCENAKAIMMLYCSYSSSMSLRCLRLGASDFLKCACFL